MKKPLLVAATLSLIFSSLAYSALQPRLKGHLGIESFGLREFSVERVISASRDMGLDYVEIYAGHVGPASEPEKIEEARKLLAAKNVKLSAAFVGNVVPDINVNRTFFDFARKMGTRVIVVNQIDERGIDGLNKLCAEYPEIRVCLHNHGPRSQGESLAKVQVLLAKLHPHVGACIDTGHVMRSWENPVTWAKALQGRIFGVHLKEYHGWRPLGPDIDMPTKEFLIALADGGFPDFGAISVEFEGTPKDPFESIAVSVDYAKKVMAEVNARK